MRARLRTILRIAPFLVLWAAGAAWLGIGVRPLNPQAPQRGELSLANAVLAGHDTLSHDYPAYWWGWGQIIDHGQVPLWNPSWFGGEPFVASQTFMPWYPPNWLGAWVDLPLAFNIQYPLHLLLAALVMAWAARRRGLGWLAAGFAGLAWGLGGHLATLVGPGHIQKLQTLTWLPLVTTGMAGLAGRRPWRAALALGAGLALQVTAGHLQIVWLSLVAGGLELMLTLAARGKSEVRNSKSETDGSITITTHDARRTRWRVLSRVGRAGVWGVAGVALALGLSAIFWIPTVEFAEGSNRQGDLSWEDATRGSLPPEEVYEFMLPRPLGDSMPHGRGGYLGRYGESSTSSPERVVSDYAGAATVVFALIGLIAGRRRKSALGYLLLAGVFLVLSLGRYLPGIYRAALAAIPGLAHFRSPSTMMALVAYGLALAAGIGVQAMAGGSGRTVRARQRARAIGIVMLGAGVLAAVALLLAQPRLGDLRALLKANPLDMRAGQVYFLAAVVHALRGLAMTLPFAGLWVLLKGTAPAATFSRRAISAFLLALLAGGWAVDLLTNGRDFWNAEPAADYERWLSTHWAMEHWAREDVPIRMLEAGNELSNRALTLSQYPFLLVSSTHGYHPVAPQRYFDLLGRLGFTHPNFVRLFAMNYLIVPDSVDARPPWRVAEEAEGKKLLRNPQSLYIRQVRHLRVVRGWEEILERLEDPSFNPYQSSLVLEEDAPGLRAGMTRVQGEMRLEARMFFPRPGHIDLRLKSVRRGTVTLAEPADPGWRYLQEGEYYDRNLGRMDGYFLTFFMLPGSHKVELIYDPASQRLGFHITLVTLGLLGLAVGMRLADRRRRTA